MFCTECNNLCELQDNLAKKKLYSVCLSCGYQKEVHNACIYKKNYNVKYQHNNFLLKTQFKDPTLPISGRKCKQCKNNLHYTRNENLTSTFICSSCCIKY